MAFNTNDMHLLLKRVRFCDTSISFAFCLSVGSCNLEFQKCDRVLRRSLCLRLHCPHWNPIEVEKYPRRSVLEVALLLATNHWLLTSASVIPDTTNKPPFWYYHSSLPSLWFFYLLNRILMLTQNAGIRGWTRLGLEWRRQLWTQSHSFERQTQSRPNEIFTK